MLNPYDYYITDEDYQEAAKRGIAQQTLRRRIRDLGWSKQKALTTPVRKRMKFSQEVLKIAKRNGITQNVLSARINKGWGIERASHEPVNSKSERIQKVIDANRKKDKYPQELLEMAQRNGIKIKTFRYRVCAGWDVYTAATTPTYSNEEACAIARKKSSFGLENEIFWNSRKAKSLNRKTSLNGGIQCSNQKDGTNYR